MTLLSHSSARSPGATAGAIVKTLFYPVVRYQRRQIWSANLTEPRSASQWREGETITFIGPDNFNEAVTAELAAFAGNDEDALAGVRRGDCLCVAGGPSGYLGYSYAFFAANTSDTRRQASILDVASPAPIAGLSFTAPGARGRAIYRRILNDLFIHLGAQGCQECICEIEPGNKASQAASRAAGMVLRRELTDWIVLRRLVIQHVRPVDDKAYWRVFFV